MMLLGLEVANGFLVGMRSETVVPGFELEANIGHLPKGKPLMFAGEIIYSSASMHDEERPLDKRAIAFESNGTMFFAPTTPNTAFPTHPIWQEMPTETPVASTRYAHPLFLLPYKSFNSRFQISLPATSH